MALETLLTRLEGVKRTGPDRYQAQCPAHKDKHPSLSLRQLQDGRVLVHCHAQCDVSEVLDAVGLDISALFPEREIMHAAPERRPFPAADILRCIAFEAFVVATAGSALLAGSPFSPADRDRLFVAVGRIQAAARAVGLGHAK